MLRDLWRQLADVWLDNLDASAVTGGKLMRYFQSGALSEIIDVCLECQAATSDIGIGMLLDQCGRRSTVQAIIESFTSRLVLIRRARSGADSTMNQGSIAMQ